MTREEGRVTDFDREGHVALRMSPEEFEWAVEQALEGLPPEFVELLDNVVVTVEDEPAADDLVSVGLDPERDELFGLYQGVPFSERGTHYAALPDRVVIFRGPILRACRSRREVIREVRDTVVHELGHYFGLGEEEMPY